MNKNDLPNRSETRIQDVRRQNLRSMTEFHSQQRPPSSERNLRKRYFLRGTSRGTPWDGCGLPWPCPWLSWPCPRLLCPLPVEARGMQPVEARGSPWRPVEARGAPWSSVGLLAETQWSMPWSQWAVKESLFPKMVAFPRGRPSPAPKKYFVRYCIFFHEILERNFII